MQRVAHGLNAAREDMPILIITYKKNLFQPLQEDGFSDDDLFSIAKQANIFDMDDIALLFRFSKVGTLARLGEANWKNAEQVEPGIAYLLGLVCLR